MVAIFEVVVNRDSALIGRMFVAVVAWFQRERERGLLVGKMVCAGICGCPAIAGSIDDFSLIRVYSRAYEQRRAIARAGAHSERDV
jgi:hypothetical protein